MVAYVGDSNPKIARLALSLAMTVFFDGTRHKVLFEKTDLIRALFAACAVVTAEDMEGDEALLHHRVQLENAIASIACDATCVVRVLPFLGNVVDMLSHTVSAITVMCV